MLLLLIWWPGAVLIGGEPPTVTAHQLLPVLDPSTPAPVAVAEHPQPSARVD